MTRATPDPCQGPAFTRQIEAAEALEVAKSSLSDTQQLLETPRVYLCEFGHWHASMKVRDLMRE